MKKVFQKKKSVRFENKELDNGDVVLKSSGYCYVCDQEVDFIARDQRLRDKFLCSNCVSPLQKLLYQRTNRQIWC